MENKSQFLSIHNRADLTRDLLQWFAGESRELPWRASRDLYGIWISEIMLQQTTVQTVVPYWERFMARFPDITTLAAATEAEVLAHWGGLGYYSRGRNLHAAARRIRDEFGGRLPDSFDAWLSLPGVGPYTAGAIASIGLGQAVPALDANARRVIMRWAAVDPTELVGLAPGRRQRLVDDLGARLVPVEEPGQWNEALMELGALRCGAKRADCANCPVADHCRAAIGGWVEEVPPRTEARAGMPVWCGLLCVTWRDHVLLTPSPVPILPGPWPQRVRARKEFAKLHVGLWGFPMSPWLTDHDEPDIPGDAWLASLELPVEMMLPGTALVRLGEFRHAITHYRLRVAVFRAALDAHRELPEQWVHAGGDKAQGAFFSPRSVRPPLSALTEKASHLQLDSLV